MGNHWSRLLVILIGVFASSSAHAEELVIGFSYAKPPYVFAQSPMQTGDLRGIELDIMREALALKGHTFKPRFFPYNRLNDALKAGKVDAIATVRPELNWPFYSAPYVHFHNVAITKPETQANITGIPDLSQRTIAAWQGADKDLGEEFAKAASHAPIYKEIGDQQQQVLLFLIGRVDTLVIDSEIFKYWAKLLGHNPDGFIFHDIFGGQTRFVAGFTSKNIRDDFNDGLKRLYQDQRYEAFYAKYR